MTLQSNSHFGVLCSQILLRIEEATVMQTACECLASLFIRFKTKIKEQSKIREVLQITEYLLSSNLEDRPALMVGPLLQVFIRIFGAELPSDLIQQIFSAMLRSNFGRHSMTSSIYCFQTDDCSRTSGFTRISNGRLQSFCL